MLPLTVATRLVPPMLTDTVAPASLVPLMLLPTSKVLTMLSVATVLMTGAEGAVASMVVAAAVLKVPWLPPAFCTTAVKLWAPSVSAALGVSVQLLPETTASPNRVVPS